MRPLHSGLSTALLLVALGWGAVACSSGNAQTAGKSEGSSEPSEELAVKPAQPATISKGQPVELASYLDGGRYTVFDFTSKYCGPCRQINPYLDRLHASREDVTVVKVDINRPNTRGIDFQSPVARQYRLMSIPHFKVYDPEGTMIAEGRPAWDLVVKWIIALDQPQAQG